METLPLRRIRRQGPRVRVCEVRNPQRAGRRGGSYNEESGTGSRAAGRKLREQPSTPVCDGNIDNGRHNVNPEEPDAEGHIRYSGPARAWKNPSGYRGSSPIEVLQQTRDTRVDVLPGSSAGEQLELDRVATNEGFLLGAGPAFELILTPFSLLDGLVLLLVDEFSGRINPCCLAPVAV